MTYTLPTDNPKMEKHAKSGLCLIFKICIIKIKGSFIKQGSLNNKHDSNAFDKIGVGSVDRCRFC